MKKLPIGIQNIKEILQGNYVYVDKTKYVYDLLNDAKCYFLSRPRRFGKSLLLDTIAEVFHGDRELFSGLWIYDSAYDFAKHPVIRLDMSNMPNETPDILKQSLLHELKKRARNEGFDDNYENPAEIFKDFIENLHNKYKQKVVVLIDEYDKPILDHILDVETAEANRAVLRGFYGILKSMDPYLRLTFITGVSKFTKTSIFSELNNLLDITMSEKYANICGIPVEALEVHFHEHIEGLADKEIFQRFENIHDEILAWYDGYSWDGITRVINPFGLLTFFAHQRFSSYWYASGSPKFLIDMIKTNPEIFARIQDTVMNEMVMDNFTVQNIQAAPLLFQTGYLTVKEVLHGTGSTAYRLAIPNREVREAFSFHIFSELSYADPSYTVSYQWDMQNALQTADMPHILTLLRSLFAAIPYQLHINREAYYHSLFFAVMSVLGFDVEAEVSTSMGRIDAVLALADMVYIFEFKYADCAPDASPEDKRRLFDEALDAGVEQIMARGYAHRYAGSGKAIIQAAFAFLGRDDIEMRVI